MGRWCRGRKGFVQSMLERRYASRLSCRVYDSEDDGVSWKSLWEDTPDWVYRAPRMKRRSSMIAAEDDGTCDTGLQRSNVWHTCQTDTIMNESM